MFSDFYNISFAKCMPKNLALDCSYQNAGIAEDWKNIKVTYEAKKG